MNIKKELEKALSPMNIKVLNFKDVARTSSVVEFESDFYGVCKGCDFEGNLEETGKCEACQEQEDEAMEREMWEEYYRDQGAL